MARIQMLITYYGSDAPGAWAGVAHFWDYDTDQKVMVDEAKGERYLRCGWLPTREDVTAELLKQARAWGYEGTI